MGRRNVERRQQRGSTIGDAYCTASSICASVEDRSSVFTCIGIGVLGSVFIAMLALIFNA
jgi:hypothetical protein